MSSSSQINTNSACSNIRSEDDISLDRGSSRTPPSEPPSLRPYISRGQTCGPWLESRDKGHHQSFDRGDLEDELTSVEWFEYIDPVKRSEDDVLDHEHNHDHITKYYRETHRNDAFPATSKDFADLFPSSRRLEIRHDDATIDGNMNLRIDTTLSLSKTHKRKITLFHLRMQDLRNRQLSLRRYCRDSGREVCSSSRKDHELAGKLARTRSFNTFFASLKQSTPTNLKRQDSGYDSIADDEDTHSKGGKHKILPPGPPDAISLEFSNYAHLDIRRRGFATAKHYDFEYWGVSYSWKRRTRKTLGATEVSFHLLRRHDKQLVAHIVPVCLTDNEARDEVDAGGWVPPCSMWLSDQELMDVCTGVSDVVIATGLVALVDDSIRRRFHMKEKKHFLMSELKRSSLPVSLGQMGPKNLIHASFGCSDEEKSRRMSS